MEDHATDRSLGAFSNVLGWVSWKFPSPAYAKRRAAEKKADAKKAAAAGEYDKAIKLAGEAEHQGILAVKQQTTEAERVSKLK